MRAIGGNVTIERSVLTGNFDYTDGAVYASETASYSGSLTVGESDLFALNGSYGTAPNVSATAAVTKTNLGNNVRPGGRILQRRLGSGGLPGNTDLHRDFGGRHI